MSNQFHENDVINEWVKKAEALVGRAVGAREKLTPEEIEELRSKITIARAFIVTRVLLPASNSRSEAELAMDGIEGKEQNKYFKAYSGKEYKDAQGLKKKYTASVAESLSRKAMKAEGQPYYKLKEEFLKAKSFEGAIYQLLKSLDQVANALSAISKT